MSRLRGYGIRRLIAAYRMPRCKEIFVTESRFFLSLNRITCHEEKFGDRRKVRFVGHAFKKVSRLELLECECKEPFISVHFVVSICQFLTCKICDN